MDEQAVMVKAAPARARAAIMLLFFIVVCISLLCCLQSACKGSHFYSIVNNVLGLKNLKAHLFGSCRPLFLFFSKDVAMTGNYAFV